MSTPRIAAGSRIAEGAALPASVPRKSRIRKNIEASWVDALAFVVVAIFFLCPLPYAYCDCKPAALDFV